MKKLILIVLTGVWIPALASDAEDAEAKLYEYFEVFNQKDAEKVANVIYSTPVHIGGGTAHRVLATPEAAVENLTNLYAQIEGQGWRESVIENLQTCVLSETLALVDTRYSRMDNDGNPIPPAIRTTLYVVQKIDGDWRIVAFYGHDNESRPSCGQE